MTDQPTQAMPGGPVVGGRYRLLELCGRGGSAEVWAALDEALDRRVAVKVVTASGGEDAGRVGDEARLLARLNHPGLVPVYDAGTDDSGRPWVVMELVEGETLADTIARGPIEPQRVAQLGRGVAEALAYVHAQGMVHRDVKPANLLVGKDGRVRLTDFGIARLVDAAKVTATGLTVGTASYLSPEQVTGQPVGPPTDVYALGLVLLEALTGVREYPGAAVEVALARLHRQPSVPPELPLGWPALLVRMTDRDPARRPAMTDVAADLARMSAGSDATTVISRPAPPPADRTQVLRTPPPAAAPTRAVPQSAPVAAPVPARRSNGWAWALALAALVGVLALGAFALSDRSITGRPDPVAPDVEVPTELRQELERLQRELDS